MIEFEGEKKKPLRVGSVRTVDAGTGEVTAETRNAFTLLPPPGDVCQECATDHPHDQPHNRQSMYYQMAFHARHGRWPTWTDAIAHCAPEVRERWRPLLIDEMRRAGMPIPEDLVRPED